MKLPRFQSFQIHTPGFSWGFTLVELIISLAVFSLLLLTILGFVFWLNYSGSKTSADREVLENVRRAMEVMVSEVRASSAIYTPTTAANQLSLATFHYLPTDETSSYIDFFLCGTALCLKKESQDPIPLTADSVDVTGLQFARIANGATSSVEITLTVQSHNPGGATKNNAAVTLTSTAALRQY